MLQVLTPRGIYTTPPEQRAGHSSRISMIVVLPPKAGRGRSEFGGLEPSPPLVQDLSANALVHLHFDADRNQLAVMLARQLRALLLGEQAVDSRLGSPRGTTLTDSTATTGGSRHSREKGLLAAFVLADEVALLLIEVAIQFQSPFLTGLTIKASHSLGPSGST